MGQLPTVIGAALRVAKHLSVRPHDGMANSWTAVVTASGADPVTASHCARDVAVNALAALPVSKRT